MNQLAFQTNNHPLADAQKVICWELHLLYHICQPTFWVTNQHLPTWIGMEMLDCENNPNVNDGCLSIRRASADSEKEAFLSLSLTQLYDQTYIEYISFSFSNENDNEEIRQEHAAIDVIAACERL